MKYLKEYEDLDEYMTNDNNIKNIKKLLSHITNILHDDFYFEFSNYYENQKFETEFYSDTDKFLFFVNVDYLFGNHLTIFSFFIESDFIYFFMNYFKTIKGLKINMERSDKIVYDIVGNIDGIISQINKDDINSKFEIYKDTKKYNL